MEYSVFFKDPGILQNETPQHLNFGNQILARKLGCLERDGSTFIIAIFEDATTTRFYWLFKCLIFIWICSR